MIESEKTFKGFNRELFTFFNDLEKNNNIDWFHRNKHRYTEFLVKPAKAFVTELAPFLNRLNPAIRSEPKFNKTLMRINKDMRFAKGAPYKNYFLIHFGRFKLDSEFFVYFDAQSVQIGIFLNNSEDKDLYFNKNLKRYKKQMLDVFDQYKINNKYSLYNLGKNIDLVLQKFHANKHIDKFDDMKYILLQKANDPSWKKVFSDQLIIEVIKMISALYPIYCFAISPQPMKELQKFEDNFGTIV